MHCRRYSSTPIHESHRRTPQSQADSCTKHRFGTITAGNKISTRPFLPLSGGMTHLMSRGVCEYGRTTWPFQAAILPCCHLQLYSITFPSKVLQHCSCSDVLTLAVWAWLNEKVSHDKAIKRCNAAAEQQQYQSSWNGFTVDGHWIHIEYWSLVGMHFDSPRSFYVCYSAVWTFLLLLNAHVRWTRGSRAKEILWDEQCDTVTLGFGWLLIFDICTPIPFNDFWSTRNIDFSATVLLPAARCSCKGRGKKKERFWQTMRRCASMNQYPFLVCWGINWNPESLDWSTTVITLACLSETFVGARSAAKFKSQSAGRKQYPYWKHMWLHSDSFLKRKQQLRPRIYVPTAYRRWTIEDRFVQSPRGSSVIATFALFRRAVEFHMESISTPEDELVRSVIDRTATYQSWSDGCFGSEEKRAFCNYFFDILWLSMSSLCQSIYCRTSCPFCLQVRSLKQKRLRRRANKSRKEKIPARRSPGALIRHSKNNFSKKTDDFSLKAFWTVQGSFGRVRTSLGIPVAAQWPRWQPPAVGINSHRATASDAQWKNMSDGFGWSSC